MGQTIVVDGVSYVSSGDVAERVGVARQTLWRWRKAGKVPSGYVYRDTQVLFTLADAQRVQAYAHRMQPAETSARHKKGSQP